MSVELGLGLAYLVCLVGDVEFTSSDRVITQRYRRYYAGE